MTKLNLLLALAAVFLGPTMAFADLPSMAVVQFGREDVGSSFPRGHDESGHARDKLVPGAVHIRTGGVVYFEVPEDTVHQVAIYGPGKDHKSVDTQEKRGYAGCARGADRFIVDEDGLMNGPLPDPPCAGGPTQVVFQFNAPGKHYVVCTFDSHFESRMEGWVHVGDGFVNGD